MAHRFHDLVFPSFGSCLAKRTYFKSSIAQAKGVLEKRKQCEGANMRLCESFGKENLKWSNVESYITLKRTTRVNCMRGERCQSERERCVSRIARRVG
eukprot:2114645-Pleurochrysis_carterae.AAC.2